MEYHMKINGDKAVGLYGVTKEEYDREEKYII